MCKILPARHVLTGSDTTSKVGTKAGALTAHPTSFLKDFGKRLSHVEASVAKAEEYFVQVLKCGTPQ